MVGDKLGRPFFFWAHEEDALILFKAENGDITEVQRWGESEAGAEQTIIEMGQRLNREAEQCGSSK